MCASRSLCLTPSYPTLLLSPGTRKRQERGEESEVGELQNQKDTREWKKDREHSEPDEEEEEGGMESLSKREKKLHVFFISAAVHCTRSVSRVKYSMYRLQY